MRRFFTAKFVETATFVTVFSIPPAVMEIGADMIWWAVILSRLFNIGLNAFTLLYCQQFGDWLTSVSLRPSWLGKATSSLLAILVMQVPLSMLFLCGLNKFVPESRQVFAKPLLITIGLSVLMWSYETWFCPWCERRIPWLSRLMKEPVRTTGTAATQVVGHVARKGRQLHQMVMKGGSNPQ